LLHSVAAMKGRGKEKKPYSRCHAHKKRREPDHLVLKAAGETPRGGSTGF